MRRRGEEGYVLAGALVALLAISLVAGALVSAAVSEVRRVSAAESAAADEAALDAAIVLAAAELTQDASVRTLKLDGTDSVTIGGRAIGVTLGWENDKLDVNLASAEAVAAALSSQGVSGEDRLEILRRFEARDATPPPLVDALVEGLADGEKARAVLTTFGGRSDWTENEVRETIAIGMPAPGSRIWIVTEVEGPPYRAREAVLLLTGDPADPFEVLDQRSVRGPREGRDGS